MKSDIKIFISHYFIISKLQWKYSTNSAKFYYKCSDLYIWWWLQGHRCLKHFLIRLYKSNITLEVSSTIWDHKFNLWIFIQKKICTYDRKWFSENTNQDDYDCLHRSWNCDVVARSYFRDVSEADGPVVQNSALRDEK